MLDTDSLEGPAGFEQYWQHSNGGDCVCSSAGTRVPAVKIPLNTECNKILYHRERLYLIGRNVKVKFFLWYFTAIPLTN